MTIAHQKYPNRLRQTIKQAGFTVEQIAGETEIPLRTLFDYCAGRVPIPRNRLEVLASTLGYPTEYVVPPYPDSDTAYSLKPAMQIDKSSPTNRRDEVTSLFSNIAARDRSAQLPSIDEATPADLESFAALTDMCRRLSEGNELGIAEKILWSYLPRIESIAKLSFSDQRRAADIASQGFLLAASLAGHRNNLQARHSLSEQALCYGKLAQDRNLQIAAIRQLAITFDYLERPDKVLYTYQQAIPYLEEASPLLRSCIYAGISGTHTQLNQRQEALRFLGMAYEQFPEEPDGSEQGFLSTVCGYSTLVLCDGLHHLHFGQSGEAAKIFARIDGLQPRVSVPERNRIDLLNHQVEVFIALRNMEQACHYLEVAGKASVAIGSERRFQESFSVFQQMQKVWHDESLVQNLESLFNAAYH